MRPVRSSFVLRRMGSQRLVLTAALLTTVITAALTAALASFAAQALPQAIHRQLVTARSTSILANGALNARLAGQDGRAIAAAIHSAFGPLPAPITSALWSDPLGIPGRTAGRLTPLIAAAAPEHVRAQVVLASGRWPGPPGAGRPVPAAVPAAVARLLHLRLGQLLALRDRDNGAPVQLRLTGIFRPRDPASPYWGINLVAATGVSVQGSFATYGPLVVNPAAFAGGGLAVGQASWVIRPRVGRLTEGGTAALAGRLSRTVAFLQSPRLNGLSVTTTLPGLLADLARSAALARSLLAIGALQLVLLAAAALALAAGLLAGQRGGESALLSARGGTRWQLARLGGAESVLVAAVAVIGGALLGTELAGLLLRSGPPRAVGLRPPGLPATVWLAAGAVGLMCVVLMLRPALGPSSPGSVLARRGRARAVTGIVRAGADLALVVVAVIAGWQLRRYSAIAQGAGRLGVDPVLVLAPVLALAAGTVILLRLLPVMSRMTDRLAARRSRLGLAVASWEIGRRPVRQGASALLVVLAVATCTLALAQHQTWRRSAADQAAFSVGADVRTDLAAPVRPAQAGAIAHAAGVLAAVPVARLQPTPTGSQTLAGQVLALDTRQAPGTVLLRSDLSPLPERQLWRRISPPADGLAVPGRPARLQLTASLSRSPGLGPMQLDVIVRDAAGVSYALPAGSLLADGRAHRLTATLAAPGSADYPVRLTGLTLSYTLPARPTSIVTATISGVAAAARAAGPFPAPFATGRALAGWRPEVSAVGLSQALADAGSSGIPAGAQRIAGWRSAGQAGQALAFAPGYGGLPNTRGAAPTPLTGTVTMAVPPAAGPLPAIATRGFLSATGLSAGQSLAITLDATLVPVKVVAEVTAFPTVGAGGALIVSLPALQELMTSRSGGIVSVSQWWLKTRSAATPPLPAHAAVASRSRLTTALLANPMTAVPQQAILAIAAAAIVVAALGFSVSVAASVRERRGDNALLAALGVSRGGQAGLLCLEQLMLSLPAAAAGLLLGAAVTHLLVRSVTLTATATSPMPPVVILLPWGLAGVLALLVAAVPVLAAALTIVSRPDPAAELRSVEA
jgi:FtsX-like permease family